VLLYGTSLFNAAWRFLHPPQDILQVLLGVDIQVPAGLDQRQNRCAGLAAFFTADKR
jgi:hypothetical protein